MGNFNALEDEIELLRDRLNSLIDESIVYKKDFSTEILLLSQKLDKVIVLYTNKLLNINK